MSSRTVQKRKEEEGGISKWVGALTSAGPLTGRDTPAATTLVELPIDKLDDNPFQPRLRMDPKELEELAASIKGQGLKQHITVRPVGERYQIAYGHRRVAALKLLRSRAESDEERERFGKARAEITPKDDQQMFRDALTENMVRANLSPVEEGASFSRYKEMFALKSADEVAEHFSLPVDRVKRLLQINDAPQVIKDAITKGVMVPAADPAKPGEEGRERRRHEYLDFTAALEFLKLFAHYQKTRPNTAEERLEKLIRKALVEGWTFKKVVEYRKGAMAPQATGAEDGEAGTEAAKTDEVSTPHLKLSQERLVLDRTRLGDLAPDVKLKLRQALEEILRSLG